MFHVAPDGAGEKYGVHDSTNISHLRRWRKASTSVKSASSAVNQTMKFILLEKERISPNYTRKISDVLMEFTQEIAPADSAPHIFGNAVGLAVLLWNTPLLPEAAQAENLDRIRAFLAAKQRLDLQTEIARLLELRQSRYGADRRFVVDYKLEYEAKGPRLSVASLDMDRPENQGR